MRTLFSSRIRGHLWGYCACNVVSLHYVPHQNLGRHRYPSRTLRRYSVPDARKTDSAYLCQRPFTLSAVDVVVERSFDAAIGRHLLGGQDRLQDFIHFHRPKLTNVCMFPTLLGGTRGAAHDAGTSRSTSGTSHIGSMSGLRESEYG